MANQQHPPNNQIKNNSSENVQNDKSDTNNDDTEYRPLLKTSNGYIAFHKVSQAQRRTDEIQSVMTPLILEEDS